MEDLKLLERKLHHLVVLRASQINGCAFCVKMHISEAKADGETLERLIVWRHSDDFSDAEKAAFAWMKYSPLKKKQKHLNGCKKQPNKGEKMRRYY